MSRRINMFVLAIATMWSVHDNPAHAKAIDAAETARLIAVAWPLPNEPVDPDAAPVSKAQRLYLRTALTSGNTIDDDTLAEGLAIALTTGSVHQRSRLVGMLDGPEASKEPLLYRIVAQRPGLLEKVIRALAVRPYPDALPWVSAYRQTVRSLFRDILAKGTPSQRRAVATFPMVRAKAIGAVDGAAKDIAISAMQYERNRAMMIRPTYDLWRENRALAAPFMALLGLKPPSLDSSGPFDLDERVAGIEEELCGVDEETVAPEAEVETDDTAARIREVVMTATDRQLAILDAHTGRTSRALAYRRCEILLKRYDVAEPGTPSRDAAAKEAVGCLAAHVTRYPTHGDAGLELARMFEDTDREKPAVAQLKRLLTDAEDRVRVLAGYRLLGKALRGGRRRRP